MLNNSFNPKRNILDFEMFKSRKKATENKLLLIKQKHNNIILFKDSKLLEEVELSNKIHNIKQSVQRINKLIEELRQISDKPNK
ncbi:hypothetical protein QEJ31_11980 [Pigmentibacter sp. JX0631]|uniref:hypothetical protein n=1 Tax=Pigmentibacter sp. JX0631 TaxID=2976982 RepID=UPI002469A3A9|nr:hypothetical protein [Pigmentibacter sp. JX0631]WGL59241.1 hypothetical protein QEJ31_11980 [Pigmentibacter sp. JX0631]